MPLPSKCEGWANPLMCDEHKRNANGYWVQLWCVEKTESLSQLNPLKKKKNSGRNLTEKKSYKSRSQRPGSPQSVLNFLGFFQKISIFHGSPIRSIQNGTCSEFPAINMGFPWISQLIPQEISQAMGTSQLSTNQAFIVIRIMGFSRRRGTTGAEHRPWPP